MLYAAVREFIETGEPVGSRTLAKKHGFELSPATIRNVLSDLEEFGYLSQPHASAGRIPTETAFRLFIDALMRVRELTAEESTRIGELFLEPAPGDQLFRRASRLLSDMTGAAAVLVRTRLEARTLTKVRFISLGQRVLAVLVMSDGTVENRYIDTDRPPSERELERLHNMLEEVVHGRTLEGVQRHFEDRLAEQRDELRGFVELGRSLLGATIDRAGHGLDILIEGQAHLLGRPEFATAGHLRGLFDALDQGEKLVSLLQRVMETQEVQVALGDETSELGSVSLVAAPYQEGGRTSGALGVIGPTRMDYSAVVPLVGATAEAMSAALTRGRDSQPGGDKDD